MSKPKIFIDGEAGTTGLQIRARLQGRDDLEPLSIDPARRKDEAERKRLLNAADLAVLCLHDDLARAAVGMIENPSTRVLDASTAHRVADGWTFGFPELTKTQPEAIRAARLVSNPGCYSTGAIALLRPVIDAGLIPAELPVFVQGASGYTGGGRTLIDAMKGQGARSPSDGASPYTQGEHYLAGPYRMYGLSLAHKHVPEMKKYSRLAHDPIFTPSVGDWAQGMLVHVPLHLWALPKKVTGTELHQALSDHYAGRRFVRVMPLESNAVANRALDPEGMNGTNLLELFVFDNPAKEQALLVARLDNLGKGASGAAVQNIDLMLGLSGEHDYTYFGD